MISNKNEKLRMYKFTNNSDDVEKRLKKIVNKDLRKEVLDILRKRGEIMESKKEIQAKGECNGK